jgi:hypothetical protein
MFSCPAWHDATSSWRMIAHVRMTFLLHSGPTGRMCKVLWGSYYRLVVIKDIFEGWYSSTLICKSRSSSMCYRQSDLVRSDLRVFLGRKRCEDHSEEPRRSAIEVGPDRRRSSSKQGYLQYGCLGVLFKGNRMSMKLDHGRASMS